MSFFTRFFLKKIPPQKPVEQCYVGHCCICGYDGEFTKNNPSFREGYQCPNCRASLRYRGQAASIIKIFGDDDKIDLNELARQDFFKKLNIYEPGVTGPFRNLFSDVENYRNSFYWDDVELGSVKDGLECQSLEALTYDDNQFDLVISSDIMEHVRRPWDAFADIFRVLKPGGYHVFSIPVHLPMPSKTKYRVDTTGDEDIHLDEPHYHGNGMGGKSLVYTDYGADIEAQLKSVGYHVKLDTMSSKHEEVQRLVTFVTQKPLSEK